MRTHGGGDRPCLRGHGPALLSPNWSDTPTPAPLLGPRCFTSNPPTPGPGRPQQIPGSAAGLALSSWSTAPLARWEPAGSPGVSLASLKTAPQAEEQAGPGAQPVLAQVELGNTFLPVAQGLAGRATKVHLRILVQVRSSAWLCPESCLQKGFRNPSEATGKCIRKAPSSPAWVCLSSEAPSLPHRTGHFWSLHVGGLVP